MDGVWCIDINENDGKKVKSRAGVRKVPIHDQLVELGFLDFVAAIRAGRSERLFPDYSYCSQNGYGRNLGRWFNESFLPKLGMKGQGLVFHSFRHTMVTELGRADVPEPIIKAIVGHEQAGVTHRNYMTSGYDLRQLHAAIHKFPVPRASS